MEIGEVLQPVVQAIQESLGDFGVALNLAVSAISGATSAAIEFSGGISSALASIRGVTKQVDGFVAALSPGALVQFNRAIQDVYATIGTAFLPIFQILTNALRDVAGSLLPVMQELQPVIAQLTNAFVDLLLPYVRIFAAALSAVIPLFKVIADLITIVVEAWQPMFALVEALVKVIGELIVSFVQTLQPYIVQFANFLKKASEELTRFIVMLGKALGANKFVNDFLVSLKRESQQGQVSATQAKISNVEKINKDIQQAAFSATGGVKDEKKQSDTDRLIAELKAINPTEGVQDIARSLKRIQEIAEYLWNKGQQAASAASYITKPISAIRGPDTRRDDEVVKKGLMFFK